MSLLVEHRPITVVILAGGRATRLNGMDKLMVRCMGGEPLLAYIAAFFLRSPLIQKVAIATVNNTVIPSYFRSWQPLVEVIHETEPHGTGGDLLRAVRQCARSAHVLAVNGDTVLDLDLPSLYFTHCKLKGACTVALTRHQGLGVQNVGAFKVDHNGTILSTLEAESNLRIDMPTHVPYTSYSSTGAILYRTDALLARQMLIQNHSSYSTERQLLPHIVASGQAQAFDNQLRPMIDNGSPERMSVFLKNGERFLLSIYGPPSISI